MKEKSFFLISIVFSFTIFAITSTLKAQLNTLNLQGTQWRTIPTTNYYGDLIGIGTEQCFLNFGKNEAAYACTLAYSGGTYAGSNVNNSVFNPMSDAPFQPKLINTPGGVTEPKWAIAKYTREGNLFTLTFSDAVVKLTRKNDELQGEVSFFDKSKPTQKWFFVQNIDDIKQNTNQVEKSIKSSKPLDNINGVWKGKYICGQGITGATLKITQVENNVKVEFLFYPLIENSAVPSGSAIYEGYFDKTNNKLSLTGISWINKPGPDWELPSISGSFDPDTNTFNGKLLSSVCGSIELKKQ